MFQRECKSARRTQKIVIETAQEMYATAPKHFHRCGQLYYMIMQTECCKERERPSPTCSPHPTPSPPTPPHPRSCPCPCPCPGSGPGPSLTQSLPYPRAVQFWKAMFSKLHKTDSRIEKDQRSIYWKYIWLLPVCWVAHFGHYIFTCHFRCFA